ncbi:MAG: hypothetical protein U1E57_08710 [Paenacidovorax caeni]
MRSHRLRHAAGRWFQLYLQPERAHSRDLLHCASAGEAAPSC